MTSYRSTLEEVIAEDLEGMGADYEYESILIPFSRPKHYKPDFILPNGIVIEAKGWFKSAHRSKAILVAENWPGLDIRFVFGRAHNYIASAKQRKARERRAKKKGKPAPDHTTYAMWCDTKGFGWAERTIPLEWIKEPPNEDSLAALEEIRQLPKNT